MAIIKPFKGIRPPQNLVVQQCTDSGDSQRVHPTRKNNPDSFHEECLYPLWNTSSSALSFLNYM